MKQVVKLGAVAAVLATTALAGTAAHANPIYVGYSINGGTITPAGNSGQDGTASFTTTVGGITITLSGTGAPFLPQGSLFSNSLTAQSSASAAATTVTLYVSETNNTNRPSSFNTGFSNNSGSTLSITEASYVTSGNTPFGTANLLSSTSVAPGAPSSTLMSTAPASLTSPYTLTEVYTIAFPANAANTVNATLSVTSNVPEPATIGLLGAGLVGLGMVRRRRAQC